jgi:ketosteroid isomerase-like protein
MDPKHAKAILDRLHRAQNAMYSGGDVKRVEALLTEDIEWHVPGQNAIAGDYTGIVEVTDYFRRRRELSGNSLQLHPGEMLIGEGEHVAVLTDGSATLKGVQYRWSTVGLYRLRGERIAACWLLALDQEAFDEAWGRVSRWRRMPGE